MKKSIQFNITRVVTRNVIVDSFQGIRNLFGLRLRGYEKMIDEAIRELTTQMNALYPKHIWHRFVINPLGKQSCMVIVYGEYNE